MIMYDSRVRENVTSEAPTTEERERPDSGGGANNEDVAHGESSTDDSDDTQFFRRIHVICMRDNGGAYEVGNIHDENGQYDGGSTQSFESIVCALRSAFISKGGPY